MIGKISYVYSYIDTDKALEYAEKEYNLAKKTDNEESVLNSYFHYSVAYSSKKDHEKALEYALKTESKGEELKDTFILLKSINSIMVAYTYLYQSEKAIPYALKFEKLAKITGDKRQLGITFTNLGVMNENLDKMDKALYYHTKALTVFEELENKYGIALANSNLGNINLILKNHKKALKYSQKGLQLSLEIENNNFIAFNNLILGNTHQEQNNSSLAIDFYEKAIVYSRKVGDKYIQCESLLALAELFAAAKEFNKASEYLNQAYPFVEEINVPAMKASYYKSAVLVSKEKGDFKTAFEQLELNQSWQDTINEQTKTAEFEDIQTKYETEKKEQENQFLAQENDLLTSRNQLYTYIGIGLAIIIAILSWLFYQIRQSKRQLERQNQLIESQNVQLENLNETKDQFFAIIAHDMRNAVFSFRGISQKVGFLIKTNQLQRLQGIGSGIDDAVNNLTNLLNNLLEWALLQKGSIPYDPAPIGVSETIKKVLNMAKNAADVKGIELINHTSDETIVFADRNSLATIVRNLVSNAIKFTDKGGKVTISTKNENNQTFNRPLS